MTPGARNLFYLKAGELGWYLLSTMMWMAVPRLGVSFETWMRANSIIWLVLAIAGFALLLPFSQGRRNTPAEGAARAALLLTALVVMIDLLTLIPELGGPQLFPTHGPTANGFYGARILVGTAAEIALWLALVRSLPSANALTPAFFGLLAATTVLALLSVVLPYETYRQLFLSSGVGMILRWLRIGLNAAQLLITIVVLRRLTGGEGVTVAVAPSNNSTAVAPPATRDLVAGVLWLGGGILVTALSYSAAASSSGGGRYIVTSGAIAYGLVRLIRGLVRLGSSEPPQ